MKNHRVFLADIAEAMAKIRRYTEGLDFEDFAANDMVVDAVARNLGVIGEAARNVPDDIKQGHPQVPWSRMIGLRNLVVHEYFGIDLRIVWEIVRVNIPETRPVIEAILEETSE